MEQADYFLFILAYVKKAHWFAETYDAHKILDDLYDDLYDEFDDFMEALLSNPDARLPKPPAARAKSVLALLIQLVNYVGRIDFKETRAPAENIAQIAARYTYLLKMAGAGS